MHLKKIMGLLLSVSMLASAAPVTLADTNSALQSNGVAAASLMPAETLEASILAKTETKVDFEENLNATIGSNPVKNGTVSFADGKTGKAAVFKTGKNYLDFQDYKAGKKSLCGKSISFAVKSNKAVAAGVDPAILSNKNWNSTDNGFVFAYSYGGNNKYKIRLDNGTYDPAAAPYARKDYDKTVYTVGIWHDYVLSFAQDGKSWSLYKDGQLETTIQTDQFNANWCDSNSYSLKLGNDGTGDYSKNSSVDYEFLIDDFLITNQPLTEEEISYLHNPPMKEDEVLTGSVTGDTEAPKADVKIIRTYKAEFRRENGMLITDPSKVTWSICEGDVTIPKGNIGNSAVVTIPAGTAQDSFTLTATYSPDGHAPVSASINVNLVEKEPFPASVEEKLETRILFENNVQDEKGVNTPEIKGTVSYAQGRGGADKGIVFKTKSGYLDFTNYIAGKSSVANKSISFSVRSNKTLGDKTDPAILANKNWSGKDKGFIFAYNWSGNNTYKTRLADGSKQIDQANMPHTLYEWHDYAMNFDTKNKKWSLYKDGALVTEKDTSTLAEGWQDSDQYTLKLGNDGTGAYSGNANVDFECVVDNFIITSQLLTAEEIKQMHKAYEPIDTGIRTANIAGVGAEKTAAGGYYNLSLYSFGENLGEVGSVEFDITYNQNAMKFDRTQFDKATTITSIEAGRAHVVSKNPISNSTIQIYSTTRMAQAVFELEDAAQDTAADIRIENVKFLDTSGNELIGITANIDCASPMICAKDRFDLNGDGVIGAGDIALAESESQKKEIAQNAAIYPYKRAVAVTIDGLGRSWSPDGAAYNNKGINQDKSIIPGEGLENVRNNPYCMNLVNNEMATSYSCLSMDPPISAQNYCSINHGKIFKNFPAEYQFTNDNAGTKHWPDINLVLNGEEPKFPSMEYAINQQAPNRRIFSYAEWTPITNAIIEPYSGAYVDYKSGQYCFNRLADYIKSGKFKNTALTYMQSDVMDHYGHNSGYFTDGYYKELTVYEEFFQTLVDTMKEADLYDDTLLIINTDHGGHNYWHETNKRMQGTHSQYSEADDRNTFMSIGGQTVNKGAKLSGGSSEDVAGIVFEGLRMDKPATMTDSTVFDPNTFLMQEDISKNGRNVETVITEKNDGTLDIALSNVQNGNVINTADMVITYQGQTAPEVAVEPGAAVLRNDAADGKLYLTISYAATPNKIASVPEAGKIEEIMLGTTEGKEIYSDLVTKSPVNDAYAQLSEDIVKGNNVSLDQVTGDLKLPETLEGAQGITICWNSSNESAVNPHNGYVTRLSNDTDVTLTAAISDGTETKEKKFAVKVTGIGMAGYLLKPSGDFAYESFDAMKTAGFGFKYADEDTSTDYTEERLNQYMNVTYGDYLFLERKKTGGDEAKVDVITNLTSPSSFSANQYSLEFDIEQVNGAPMYISSTWQNAFTLDWRADGTINVNAGKATISNMKNKRVHFKAELNYNTHKMVLYANGAQILNGDMRYGANSGKPKNLTINVQGINNSKAAPVGSGVKIYSVNCTEEYQGAMAQAVEAVNIRNLTSENTNFITQNLSLPDAPEGTAITWTSSNQAVLSNEGVITKPQHDTTVIMCAEIKDTDGNQAQYQYIMTILGTGGENPPQIKSMLVDENGNEVILPSGGDIVKAAADRQLMTGHSFVMLAAAAYTADGGLDSLKVAYGDGSSDLSTEFITVPQGGTAKAMLWDGITLKPLNK